jgi:hypothetical protein
MFTFFFTKIIPSEDIEVISNCESRQVVADLLFYALIRFGSIHSGDGSDEEILENLYAI